MMWRLRALRAWLCFWLVILTPSAWTVSGPVYRAWFFLLPWAGEWAEAGAFREATGRNPWRDGWVWG